MDSMAKLFLVQLFESLNPNRESFASDRRLLRSMTIYVPLTPNLLRTPDDPEIYELLTTENFENGLPVAMTCQPHLPDSCQHASFRRRRSAGRVKIAHAASLSNDGFRWTPIAQVFLQFFLRWL